MEGVPLGLVLDLRQVEVLGQLVLLLFGFLGLARIVVIVGGRKERVSVRLPLFNMVARLDSLGLVACSDQRHTAENIKTWTDEALESIGMTVQDLTEPTPPAPPATATAAEDQ